MIKRFAMLLGLIAAFTLSATAQIVNPVKWTVEARPAADGRSGVIVWTAKIDDGYHIYGFKKVKDGPEPTAIHIDSAEGLTFNGDITPSKPTTAINDKAFYLVLDEWTGTVEFSRHYTLNEGATGAVVNSTVSYMSCNEKSCQAPRTEALQVTVGGVSAATTVMPDSVGNQAVASVEKTANSGALLDDNPLWNPVDAGSVNQAADVAAQTSMLTLLIMGFAGGLLALLTPCVWPMIPMTVSFFLKKTKSRRRSIIDALTYGLSIIVIFLALGIAVTLIFGASKLNDIATSAVFNLFFFALLVVFAISFFGAFDIKLPSKWSNAVDNKAETTTGLASIFLMAFTLVLVSFSCTGPIIGTLLVEAASNGSIVGPAIGMGGFALGLAVPFSLFAFFPSLLKEMPRSGGWMNSVKVVLGFIELILSLKFLSVADLAYGWRILDREVFVAIWIVLFILLGMYLLGKLRFSHDDEKKHTGVGSFFLAVASLSFAVYLLPGLWGAPLKAISAFAPPLSTQDFNLYGGEFSEFDDYDAGMAYAAEHHKPVLLDFSGYACVNCRKMEGAVFDTPEVRTAIENDYVLIKLMVDDKADLPAPITVEENGKKVTLRTVGDKWSYLQRHKFNINSQPYYVILNDEGEPLEAPRAYDEDKAAFLAWLAAGVELYNNN